MSALPLVSSPSAPAPRRRWFFIALLLLLALGLRLYRIDQQSLWIDEVSSIEVARQPIRDIVLNYRPGRHPWRGAEQAPLSFFFMSLMFSPKAQETTARLPSVLFGIAGVLVIFQLGRELLQGPVAWTSAALLAVSPLHIWYSQEARWYTLWILLTMLSYWAFFRAWKNSSWQAWLAYTLCTTLGIYTFVLSFLVMACQGFSTLLLARRQGGARFVATVLATQIVAAIAAAPVLWLILNTLGLTTGTPRPQVLAQIPYTFFTYAAGYSIGPTVAMLHALPSAALLLRDHPAILFFVSVFAPLTLLGCKRVLRWPAEAMILVPWLFGPLLLTALLALVSHVTFQARYSSAALPAFLMVTALGIEALPNVWLRFVALGAVLLAFTLSLVNHYNNPAYFKEDARAAAAFLKGSAADAPVYVVGQVGPALKFYAAALQVTDVEDCQVDLKPSDDGRLWVVVGRDWQGQGSRCLARLAAANAVRAHSRFIGIEAWLFSPIQTDSSAPPMEGTA
ncbi:MAG: glycosyltransferase family 39 protein [Deltaproteobacteria bacterium]|nr:glycosyltransferase family 39 protein [Deltaproteobacteria bacterium]